MSLIAGNTNPAAFDPANNIPVKTLADGTVNVDTELGTVEGTALVSAARTASTASADIINPSCRGIMIFLDISIASGTGGLQVTLQVKNPITGAYSQVNPSPAAITIITPAVYVIYPGATGGNVNQVTGEPIPRTFRIRVVHGDATSYTYSVSYCLLP